MSKHGRPHLPGKYPGSKIGLMRRIDHLLPPHRHLVVLFGGIGGELCGHWPPSYCETMGDRNPDNINAFRVLVEDCDRLTDRLEQMLYSETWFYECRELLRDEGRGDQWERAVAWWTVACQSRGWADPTVRAKLCWAFSIAPHRNTQRWVRVRERMEAVARRFRDVQLADRPWDWLIDRTDSGETLFLADPTYMRDTRSSATRMYKHEMTDDEHRRLLLRLRRVKGRAVVFHYSHPLYRALLRDWQVVRFDGPVQLSNAGKKAETTTNVWFNFNIPETDDGTADAAGEGG